MQINTVHTDHFSLIRLTEMQGLTIHPAGKVVVKRTLSYTLLVKTTSYHRDRGEFGNG